MDIVKHQVVCGLLWELCVIQLADPELLETDYRKKAGTSKYAEFNRALRLWIALGKVLHVHCDGALYPIKEIKVID